MSVSVHYEAGKSTDLDFPKKTHQRLWQNNNVKKAVVDTSSKIAIMIFKDSCKDSKEKAERLCSINPGYKIFKVGTQIPISILNISKQEIYKPPEIKNGDYVVIWKNQVLLLSFAFNISTSLGEKAPALAIEEFGDLDLLQPIFKEAFLFSCKECSIPEEFKHTTGINDGIRCVLLHKVEELIQIKKMNVHSDRKSLKLILTLTKWLKAKIQSQLYIPKVTAFN